MSEVFWHLGMGLITIYVFAKTENLKDRVFLKIWLDLALGQSNSWQDVSANQRMSCRHYLESSAEMILGLKLVMSWPDSRLCRYGNNDKLTGGKSFINRDDLSSFGSKVILWSVSSPGSCFLIYVRGRICYLLIQPIHTMHAIQVTTKIPTW